MSDMCCVVAIQPIENVVSRLYKEGNEEWPYYILFWV